MIEIKFKSMGLSEDERTVKIKGVCFGKEIDIEMSILQLAKIFGADKETISNAENDDGFEKYEDRCKETRDLVRKFPTIEVWDKEVEFSYVSVENESWVERSTDPNIIGVYAEDMFGWSNEGIRIKFPKELYKNLLEGEDFKVFVKPFSVEFRIDVDKE